MRKRSISQAKRPTHAERARLLEADRARCMGRIESAARIDGIGDPLVSKARTLLTRHWATATWRGRADILTAATWLLRVHERNGGLPPAKPDQENGHASDRFRADADGVRAHFSAAAE